MPLSSQAQAGPGRGRRWLEAVCWFFAMLGVVLFLIEALLSAASISGRIALRAPVPGDYELVRMFSAVGIVLCLPYCEIKKGHVLVDFFTLKAPEPFKRGLDVTASLLMATVAFLLAWRTGVGTLEIRQYQETSMVLGLPIWWTYIPLAPAFVLLGIAALANMLQPGEAS
ncbi:TRAP transporter small permease [Pusillimonas sp.]|uniref:TRAP transporter small permease n=1 Tax=Pusillimonas sp. TaxID=3040095 RepID=UPI0037CA9BDE